MVIRSATNSGNYRKSYFLLKSQICMRKIPSFTAYSDLKFPKWIYLAAHQLREIRSHAHVANSAYYCTV